MKNRALLITGMGSNLGKYLINLSFLNNYDCFRITSDTRVENTEGSPVDEKLLRLYSELFVLHMASPNATACENEPALAYEVNVNIINTIFSKCYSKKIKKVIYFSTSRIYGDNVESSFNELSTPRIENVYSSVKYLTERVLKKIWSLKDRNLSIIILRLTNIIQILEPETSKLPLANNFCWQAVVNNKIIINNKKNIIKNFVDIRDLDYILQKLLSLNNDKTYQILNIAGPSCYTLSELAEYIQNISSKEFGLEIEINTKFEEDIFNRDKGKIDVNYAAEMLNYHPRDIKEIISKQLGHYLSSFNA